MNNLRKQTLKLAGHWIVEAALWLAFSYALIILVGTLLGALVA